MLPPTSSRLFEPDTVPYFLWDLGLTVAEVRRTIAQGDQASRDDLIARILREANSRDVWVFLDWPTIEEAFPRIERRLGRARGVWTMMRERYHEHLRSGAAA
ncbi:hypothetical protein [Polyangium aurulentum]|uniref:hypothetical protein n=1 Tax=Polyangium aurulentum TaxID=2567896 RepID=UPI0010AE840A|nr:hypothetical protein [Polyangium aurulentum]UQA56577.1 hypothetical protein E8A73_035500 [Polyangium aurulentum]